ncbi:hypothetical protein AUJ14_01765 [Candidatus Micrarchaeota archaeon CG1_02_55_22]|nr:MAG: hypothetical protein AUJ14_01765 [Candidatus Micrarchaeota archaeon CG1_02_55_22]
MQLSKSGILSLVLGILVLGAAWQYGFAQDVQALILNGLVLGGLTWLGLVLLVLGVLIILI